MAAHELDHVTLENALELPMLAAEVGDERWPRLSARRHARFVNETPGNRFGQFRPSACRGRRTRRPLSELAAQSLRQLVRHPFRRRQTSSKDRPTRYRPFVAFVTSKPERYRG
jgi:hypothetical protein